MKKPNGVILYRGHSLIDGAPIVAIAIGLNSKSTNRKTGAMLQTYILRSDVDPLTAIREGKDSSICGDCRHRGASGKGRTCYVNIGQGVMQVWKAFSAGKYPDAIHYAGLYFARRQSGDPCVSLGRAVRLGTYGDPAAVPVEVWTTLLRHSIGHTGYTHQWRKFPSLRALCMASVDSPQEALDAKRVGWRTFRVGGLDGSSAISKPMLQESLCPASKEAGAKLQCAQCRACSGADGRKGSIYIPVHGGTAVMAAVRRLQAIPVRIA